MTLTRAQKNNISEIDQIVELAGLDYKNIEEFEQDARISVLRNIKDQLVRSVIIMDYVLIDEHLCQILVNYYFGNNASPIKLWKTKKFKLFNYFVLEKLYLVNKLDHAKEIINIPANIMAKIKKINDLRNSIAHSFFPDNRRVKIQYDNKSVYDLVGFKKYQEDVDDVMKYLAKKVWKVTI